jgi:hypothetical protein
MRASTSDPASGETRAPSPAERSAAAWRIRCGWLGLALLAVVVAGTHAGLAFRAHARADRVAIARRDTVISQLTDLVNAARLTWGDTANLVDLPPIARDYLHDSALVAMSTRWKEAKVTPLPR